MIDNEQEKKKCMDALRTLEKHWPEDWWLAVPFGEGTLCVMQKIDGEGAYVWQFNGPGSSYGEYPDPRMMVSEFSLPISPVTMALVEDFEEEEDE